MDKDGVRLADIVERKDMQGLVVIENNVPVTTSYIVAEKLGIEHRSVIKLVKDHQERIEKHFGVLRFQIAKPQEGSLGGRPEQYCDLTENQSHYILTLSRNTEKAMEVKALFVKAFAEAKEQLAETQKQLTDAKAMIAALVQDVHKLPWGLERHELYLTEMYHHHIMQCIEKVETTLGKGNLKSEKRLQQLSDQLEALFLETQASRKTLREDLETNKRIDDLFFSFYDAVRPALPDPNNKSE